MKEHLEEIAIWIVGIPIVLLFSLLFLICRICGIDLEEDF